MVCFALSVIEHPKALQRGAPWVGAALPGAQFAYCCSIVLFGFACCRNTYVHSSRCMQQLYFFKKNLFFCLFTHFTCPGEVQNLSLGSCRLKPQSFLHSVHAVLSLNKPTIFELGITCCSLCFVLNYSS